MIKVEIRIEINKKQQTYVARVLDSSLCYFSLQLFLLLGYLVFTFYAMHLDFNQEIDHNKNILFWLIYPLGFVQNLDNIIWIFSLFL